MTVQDFQIEDHGTICLVTPMTAEARQWIEENVAAEPWQWIGGSLAVEPRCLSTLLEGMKQEGMKIDDTE